MSGNNLLHQSRAATGHPQNKNRFAWIIFVRNDRRRPGIKHLDDPVDMFVILIEIHGDLFGFQIVANFVGFERLVVKSTIVIDLAQSEGKLTSHLF